MNMQARLWRSLALVALTVLVYLPALRGQFIWDDDDHVTMNPAVTAPDGVRQIWSSLFTSRYYPLTLTTFWVEHRLWGLKPAPYHAVNIALHAVNAALFYWLLSRLRVPGAWIGAALWAVHPVNVESVAWITELKNVQSAFFFFSCLLCYLHFDSGRSRRWYVAALVCGAAALLSKPSTVMLPTILLLVVWWERRRWERADLLRLAPFMTMSLGMSVLTIAEQRNHVIGAGLSGWKLGLVDRCLVAGKDLWFYAIKLLWPEPLAFVYPRWNVPASSLADWLPLVGVVVLALILWRLWRHTAAAAALLAFAYFVQALLPVLGFFDVYYFRFSFVADHFNYLASAGLLALIGAACARMIVSDSARTTVVSAAMLALGALSWQHELAFHDDKRLWLDTLAKNPVASLAHNNLASIYRQEGETNEAAEHWREAIRLSPEMWQPYISLGKLDLDTGQPDEATRFFEQALRVKPDSVEAHYGLAIVNFNRGQGQVALEHLQLAFQARPEDAPAHFLAGQIYEQQGKLDQAIEQYQSSVQLDPQFADGFLRLGFLRRRQGDRERAINCFQRVLALRPGDASAHQALADLGVTASSR